MRVMSALLGSQGMEVQKRHHLISSAGVAFLGLSALQNGDEADCFLSPSYPWGIIQAKEIQTCVSDLWI